MKVTVTFYPFGKELKQECDTLEDGFRAIAAYHALTSGNADYEISVRNV